MKDYPKKSSKNKPKNTVENKFDKSKLSSLEQELLTKFKERRHRFELHISGSNTLFQEQTCPGCGYPTLSKRGDYEVCIICLWEDDGSDDKTDTRNILPNSISLVEHRINSSNFIELFENKYRVGDSCNQVIKDINTFKEQLSKGLVEIDNINFEQNLKNILGIQEV